MSTLNWAGVILIAAFVMLAVGAVAAPQDVYSGPDLRKRLDNLRRQQARWKISKVFDGLAILLPAVGFLYAAAALQASQPARLLTIGAAGFIFAAAFGAAYVIRLTLTPEIYWLSEKPSRLAAAYLSSFLVGMFAFGFVFLQAGLPAWLGYLSMGAAVTGLVGFLFFRTASPFYITALLYIVNLIVGIGLARWAGG